MELRALWRDSPFVDQANFFEFIIEALIKQYCHAGSIVVDAGANWGAHTYTMLQSVGDTGRVMAIEPDPKCASTLRGWQTKWPSLHVEEVALSDRNGSATFHVAEQRGYSSLHHGLQNMNQDGPSITVPLRRLDDLDLSAEPIALIKMDVEGEEIKALAGAKRIMQCHLPLVMVEVDWRKHFPEAALANGPLIDRFSAPDGYHMIDFFGDSIEGYDESAWNLILTPPVIDLQRLRTLLLEAGQRFFEDHRGWNPYLKLS